MANLNIGDSISIKFYDWGETFPDKPNSLKVYDGAKYWCTKNMSMDFLYLPNGYKRFLYSPNGIQWTEGSLPLIT
jgi:hypothetical protein